ncbi:prepilin peptidase [Enterococcus sp. BWT-B8]|uniref:prepilin peptidase n=1 Tax=Enterococcus sp. BWT-B8 TaxID=2885157 RepID=UPI001E5B0664|nr:A24 family peptidase [Enterococcus sp. BWT-B8]MCB5952708.1 prepilin peptidase [Enterococcus sp. BWT-B8]
MSTILLFILGTCLGSFYCLAAERIPRGESILFPTSHCSHCFQKLRFFEMVPLLSITFQRFQCRYCSKKIPFIYLLSELAGGMICVLCFFEGVYAAPFHSFLLLSMGGLLSLTDIFYLIVEPKLLLFLTFILFIWHLCFSLPLYYFTGLIIFILLTILNRLFNQAIGGGDILLLSCWGLLLGMNVILFIVFIASSSALIYALVYPLFYHKKIKQIPFVPFLFWGLLLHIILTNLKLS